MQAISRLAVLSAAVLTATAFVAPAPAQARVFHARHRAEIASGRHAEPASDPLFAYIRRQAGSHLARRYTSLIRSSAAKYHLSPLLVAGIINYESHFDTHCRTGRARGLMQVNHGHERPGQDLYDPKTNLDIGCRILREYHDWAARRMPADASSWQIWNKALTAYNFGPIQVVNRGLMRSHYSRTVIRAWRSNLPADDR